MAAAIPAMAQLKVAQGTAGKLELTLAPCKAEKAAPTDVDLAVAGGVCPTGSDGKERRFQAGRTTIFPASPTATRLRVRYRPFADVRATVLRRGGGVVLLLARRAADLRPVSEGARAAPVFPLRASTPRRLPIRVALAPGLDPSSLRGLLLLESRQGTGARRTRRTRTLAITAAPASPPPEDPALSDIVFQPSKLTVTTEDPSQETAEVTLLGDGLGDALARGPLESSVRLRDGDSELIATIEVAKSEPGSPDRATGTVTFSGDPGPGKYADKLPLSDSSPASPVLDVEVSVRKNFIWALLLIYVGALIGGFLVKAALISRRRVLLQEAVDQSVTDYERVRRDGTPKSWDLSDFLGDELDKPAPSTSVATLQGVSGIRTSLANARNDGDLDEDTERVLDLVARIQRWLRLEPAVRRLHMVAATERPETLGQLRWDATRAHRDSRQLATLAKREPLDVEEADDLVARVLRHAVWHHRFGEVWTAAHQRDDADLREKLKAVDGAAAEKSAVTRTPAEQDDLEAKLDLLISRYAVPVRDIVRPQDPPCVTPAKWSASPNLFTGWATLDGKSFGQLKDQAGAGRRGYSLTAFLDTFKAMRGDLLPSFVTAAIMAAIYAVAVYDDTWGSCEDFVTAFVAGLTGKAVVNWAQLPTFQSLRLRSKEGSG